MASLFTPAAADLIGEIIVVLVALTLLLRASLSWKRRYLVLAPIASALSVIHWGPVQHFVKYVHEHIPPGLNRG